MFSRMRSFWAISLCLSVWKSCSISVFHLLKRYLWSFSRVFHTLVELRVPVYPRLHIGIPKEAMFHLAKGLYARYTMKEEYAVLILGLDNAGKTAKTFFEKIKGLYTDLKVTPPERIHPTVGQNVTHINVDRISIKFWDLGGQESLRSMWEEYYQHCHGIVFIIDSSDKSRLEECSETLLSVVNDETITNVPILMLANKQDCDDHMEVEDVKEIFNKMAEHLSARDSRVLPISAYTGEGVKDSIDWLKVRMIRNKAERPPNFK